MDIIARTTRFLVESDIIIRNLPITLLEGFETGFLPVFVRLRPESCRRESTSEKLLVIN
jgi:hypothetical protein